MPIDWLALLAAALSGVFGGLHCALMCGGIATGIAAGAAPAPALRTALLSNLGRVLGYTLAGALVGGFGAGLLALWQLPNLALAMRMAVGAVLLLVALRLLDQRGRLAFVNRPGAAVWQWLAPLHRRLLPANTPLRQLAAGMLWGWLPCGLSATVLAAAWLSADAVQGALIMATFGFGTWLVMLPLTWSGARLTRHLARPALRRSAAALIASAGLLTLAAPWLAQVPMLHAALAALGCRTL
ncbi:MAG: hypothetical protein COW59_03105 [Lysobacterales bacterium CG17_big_fil_post_rev_8_21_14_2_50_64_11]|nr:MAG: hypothetical protein COW59_03105 [Xanthomonadales bacterium CG17_big_fil_post_rev_8_21_14_2_50_64_11]PIX59759.1 MAG: sulfite exporter TauE/SafE family protein [Xanthomonadales bacterium CG_4_10_14_3_um_filter_64_11]